MIHKNAGLWLPTGGNVEPNEYPRKTVQREAKEELDIEVELEKNSAPIILTISETLGNTEKHTDVSLWYVLLSDSKTEFNFDASEFYSVKWFKFNEMPFERSGLNLGRFISKVTFNENL